MAGSVSAGPLRPAESASPSRIPNTTLWIDARCSDGQTDVLPAAPSGPDPTRRGPPGAYSDAPAAASRQRLAPNAADDRDR